MVLIRVEYDGYNRQFKIVDRELAHSLEDGEIYLLIADVHAAEIQSELISDQHRLPALITHRT